MKTRQIQFDAVGQMSLVERELPALQRDDVLVRVERCGLCTWERYVFAGTDPMPFPFVGGHELSGVIVDLGPSAPEHLQVGMHVALGKWKRCGACEPCRQGYDNFCEMNDQMGESEYSGPAGFADYTLCRPYEVFPVHNTEVSFDQITLGEPLACVVRGVSKMRLTPGDTVAVIGAGMMGLLFLKVLKHEGYRVVVVQRSEKRRQMAHEMGADAVVNPAEGDWVDLLKDATEGQSVAGVVYTAGGGDVLNESLKAAAVGATVLMYAPLYDEQIPLDVDLIHFKELVLTGTLRHDSRSFRQAVRFIDQQVLGLETLILKEGYFENLAEAMTRADEDKDIHRVILRWKNPVADEDLK